MSKPIKKNRWTSIDAFGLLNGIGTWDKNYLNLKYVRTPGETNLDLRRKLFNIQGNPALDTSLDSLVKGIANELNLESYDSISKTNFDLSRFPHPSGDVGVQDVWLYYQPPGSGEWYEITPQLWGKSYYTDDDHTIPSSSGFTVWEDSYYKDSTAVTTKTNKYTTLLTVQPNKQLEVPLVDKSRLKIIYHVRQYDKDNNPRINLFTDISNTLNSDDTRFIYRTPYVPESGDYNTSVVAYHLDELKSSASGFYYDTAGYPTGLLYKLRDIIDNNFKHKWKDVRDRQSVWDIHKDYSKGTIQSYYDVPFVVQHDDTHPPLDVELMFTGGIEYHYPALSFMDIKMVENEYSEQWYPVLYPGCFYVNGVKYRIMENPDVIPVTLDNSWTDANGVSGSGVLPSGVTRGYHTILKYSSIHPATGIIQEEYNYPIPYRQYDKNAASGMYTYNNYIYRRRPYLTSDMGYELNLGSGEYSINYNVSPPTITCSGVESDTLYMMLDSTLVPSGTVCEDDFADLNPLNGNNIDFSKYFLVIGDE